ncbi:MAG TPA: hypothetical protein VFV08_10735, partial [Puia sp.]|nr:hypothetical protein [Puia sp.]
MMTLDFVEAPTEGFLSTMKYDNQLRLASQIVGSFRGEMPLHNWLKGYFRANKQMGSRDRKQIAELVYCYYRMGHGWKEIDIKERILQGIFLCHKNPNEILEYFKPNWNK